MTTKTLALTATAALALMVTAGASFAQSTATGSGTSTSSSATASGTGGATSTAGAFDSLSPGNQKVARALFLAQHPTSDGPMPLNLNQIAALKGKEGWGEVFRQMKSEGLVQDKNLGQVVSGYEHHLHYVAHHLASHSTIMTTASGHAFDAGTPQGHGEGARDHDADAGDARSGAAATGHGASASQVAAGNGTVSAGGGMHGGAAHGR